MKPIRIFLASSAELDADKEQVELFISRKNKDYQRKRVFLELATWKDFISAMKDEPSQETYNRYIRSCDIALFLFHTKLGRFTKIEFDHAHEAFVWSRGKVKKPLIYTFFKTDPDENAEISAFRKYVDDFEHFYDTYGSIEDLFVKLNRQLDKLEEMDVIHAEPIDAGKAVKYAIYYFLLPMLVLGSAVAAYYYYQPTDLTVRVKEVRGIPGLPFKEGTLTLTYGDKTESLTIMDEVIFKQIPSKYKRSELQLKFVARGYETVDTMITVNDYLELGVKRDNSLGLVFGWVRDEENNPLPEVTVSYKELKALTDKDGRFRIEIPLDMQADTIRVSASKEGFQMWDFTGAPSQTTEWKIQLQKKQRQ